MNWAEEEQMSKLTVMINAMGDDTNDGKLIEWTLYVQRPYF